MSYVNVPYKGMSMHDFFCPPDFVRPHGIAHKKQGLPSSESPVYNEV